VEDRQRPLLAPDSTLEQIAKDLRSVVSFPLSLTPSRQGREDKKEPPPIPSPLVGEGEGEGAVGNVLTHQNQRDGTPEQIAMEKTV